MNRTWIDIALAGTVAAVVGWIVSDTVREYRDERTMVRFHTQLEVVSGFPAHWKMKS